MGLLLSLPDRCIRGPCDGWISLVWVIIKQNPQKKKVTCSLHKRTLLNLRLRGNLSFRRGREEITLLFFSQCRLIESRCKRVRLKGKNKKVKSMQPRWWWIHCPFPRLSPAPGLKNSKKWENITAESIFIFSGWHFFVFALGLGRHLSELCAKEALPLGRTFQGMKTLIGLNYMQGDLLRWLGEKEKLHDMK